MIAVNPPSLSLQFSSFEGLLTSILTGSSSLLLSMLLSSALMENVRLLTLKASVSVTMDSLTKTGAGMPSVLGNYMAVFNV